MNRPLTMSAEREMEIRFRIDVYPESPPYLVDTLKELDAERTAHEQTRAAAKALAEALRSIKEECYTNMDCNHQEQDSKIDPNECEDIDDCIGCTLTQIADAALAQYAATEAKEQR